MDIILYVLTLAFGATKCSHKNLRFVWMILALNASTLLIIISLSIPYRNNKNSIDWEGGNYYGLNLDWNYNKIYVDVSMPGYVAKALHKFQHP